MSWSTVTDEDCRYMASEWAFYNRTQREIAAEFGWKTPATVGSYIAMGMLRALPRDDSGRWFRAFDRKPVAREILGGPVERRVSAIDFGDLWVE
jgi:hypothetical protein